jgi:hypothetical protein
MRRSLPWPAKTLYSPDETEIRQIIAEQMRAICAKDVDRVFTLDA